MIMKYKIEITETLKKVVEVEARSVPEAIAKAMDMYKESEIVLTADDYEETAFHPVRCDR